MRFDELMLAASRRGTLLAFAQHASEAHLAVVLVELLPGTKWVVWTYNCSDGGFFGGSYFEIHPDSTSNLAELVGAYQEFCERVQRSVDRL